jgi:hypothetical protein
MPVGRIVRLFKKFLRPVAGVTVRAFGWGGVMAIPLYYLFFGGSAF